MIKVIYNAGAKELAQSMFERDVADEELAAAAGALDDSTLTVSVWKRVELRVEMIFDLAPDSPMMKRLQNYLKRKRKGEKL
jgi:hypothetical protein